MSLPTVVFVAPAAVCFVSWAGAGALLPRRWLPADRLQEELARLAFGTVAFGTAALALGRVGLFEPWLLVALTVVLAGVGAARLVAARTHFAAARLPQPRAARVLLALTAAALVLDVVASAVPPTSADAVKYHLAVPERWLELGRVGDPFWNWQGFSPFGVEMLYAQGLAFGGGEVAGAIGGMLVVLATAAVYALVRAVGGGEVAAAAAAALFSLQGLTTWEATSAFVELGLSFYVALGACFAVALRRAPEPRLAAWASFCCGAAAGAKYIGLLPAAIVIGAAAAAAWRAAPRLLPYLVLPALAAGGPWYLRNALATGNPLYPLYFGGKGWGADDDLQLQHLDEYGTGSLLRLPLLPLDLLLHGEEFDRGRYVGTGIFLFALLALVLRPRRELVGIWVGAAVFAVVWWEGSAQARFLLPMLAALAAVAGIGVEEALGRGRRARLATIGVLTLVVAAWAVSSAALTRQLLPAAFGLESRADATQRLTGTYDAMRAFHRRTGDDVVAFAGYAHTYPYPGPAISLNSPDFGPGASRQEALARLGVYDVRWIVAPEHDHGVPQMRPLRGCVRRVARHEAEFVTSRALEQAVPMPLVLYELRRQCRRG